MYKNTVLCDLVRDDSDESDAYRDGGRVCPVNRGVVVVVSDHMFNYCVLRHVLHKVCF